MSEWTMYSTVEKCIREPIEGRSSQAWTSVTWSRCESAGRSAAWPTSESSRDGTSQGLSRQFYLNCSIARFVSSCHFEVTKLLSFYEPKKRPKFNQKLARVAFILLLKSVLLREIDCRKSKSSWCFLSPFFITFYLSLIWRRSSKLFSPKFMFFHSTSIRPIQ